MAPTPTTNQEVLVFFALSGEASPFRSWAGTQKSIRIVVTGMGMTQAGEAARKTLETARPTCVLTCGFTGGLNPDLPLNTVVMECDDNFPLQKRMLAGGAFAGRFYCSQVILATSQAKSVLRQKTGADAVDMESEAIRNLCRERSIPSATVRIISDAADQDLPMDFNQFMTRRNTMNYPRLIGSLLRSPGRIPKLLAFQRNLNNSAQLLARFLENTLTR
jgi:purine-nucleoside phosphorylase